MHKFIDNLKANYKLIILLFVMLIVYFYKLSGYPLINLDETWLAGPSWNFVKHGKFVNLAFTGYYNKETLDLIYPVYHFMLIPVFKFFGLNITAARALSVVLGLFTLALVYFTVKIIYKNENIAVIAGIILGLNSVFFLCSRDMRPDAYVAFFAVLSFYLLIKAVNSKKILYCAFCGVSAGCVFLCHPIGLFVIAALFLAIFFTPFYEKNKYLSYYAAGAGVVVFGWAFHILAYEAFYKQLLVGVYGGRIFFIKSIFISILKEYRRWLLLSARIPALFGLASLIYLAFMSYKKKMPDLRQRLLVNYTFILFFLFTVAEKSKGWVYSDAVFPFFAMVTAGAFYYIYKEKKVLAVGLLVLFLCANGIFIPYKLYKFSNSNYNELLKKCAEQIPKGAVVMAQGNYWFGLEKDYEFRTNEVFYLLKGRCGTSFKTIIKVMKINYIIFDNYWKFYFKDNYPGDEKERDDFFKNDCVLVKTITDPYYGQESEKLREADNIKIYKVK